MSFNLKYSSLDGRLGLKVTQNMVVRIQQQVIRDWPNETGGILVGFYTESLDCAVVTEICDTSKDSAPNLRRFTSNPIGIAKMLSDVWLRTDGGEYYIGEWHSHPGNSPLPSNLDDDTMHDISKNDGVNAPQPILLIAGYSAIKHEDFAAYVYSDGFRIDLVGVA